MFIITTQLLNEYDICDEYREYFNNLYGNEFTVEQLLKIEHELKYIVFLLYNIEELYVEKIFNYIRKYWPLNYDAICYSCVHRKKQYIASYYG